ncbi:MAG: BolA family transcriptional regulator [Elusimicrobia bacterium]|nr:MAG: BolA family transcriptional regulator [Elusimicrobiota bacterium]
MMLEALKNKIEEALPGATVQVLDPMQDGEHLQAIVIYEGFEGKTLIEQHRMVTDPIKDELKGPVHALAIKTKVRE